MHPLAQKPLLGLADPLVGIAALPASSRLAGQALLHPLEVAAHRDLEEVGRVGQVGRRNLPARIAAGLLVALFPVFSY